MNSSEARIFVENWFDKVWVQSSVDNLKSFYDSRVKVTANGSNYNIEELIKHCEWCRENEKIVKVDFADVVAEGNIIAFRVRYKYADKNQSSLTGENIGIMHLNADKKIIQIDVKSSEVFSTN
ncbi:hypothetical protein ACQUW5_00640 [Legionella sp. CNM-1927-20]|uniref:hypothetical protein n=1 Tax=Legionella sp. CNM-1927-20 TaxID=3422221 RepID=UPI00403B2349